ncbi:hypothetical protein C8Q79DRAFT_203656 [Trametes meyenii]|nr:hypothetical protein C8Q79DRAFT_203656 [Trametes meyenii]
MVQGQNLGRTKSEMEIDGPSNNQRTNTSPRVVFSPFPSIIHPESPSTPHISHRPPTPFYTPCSSLPSEVNADDEHLVDMGSSQDSQVSHMSFSESETMDSEDLPGTREPTPVPELPPTQGLQKMQSIVLLGPAATSGRLPTEVPPYCAEGPSPTAGGTHRIDAVHFPGHEHVNAGGEESEGRGEEGGIYSRAFQQACRGVAHPGTTISNLVKKFTFVSNRTRPRERAILSHTLQRGKAAMIALGTI